MVAGGRCLKTSNRRRPRPPSVLGGGRGRLSDGGWPEKPGRGEGGRRGWAEREVAAGVFCLLAWHLLSCFFANDMPAAFVVFGLNRLHNNTLSGEA